ncbi:septum formation initiator family protein [Caldisericum exile]|uniref:Septum formation initiator family protein n=1 Tax=Caldisericum exile (strain DSM 21853 / NBRC 104410 / AZM16c01) TaxID=511051 RepID=A0A7U6GFC2_CALEA|nr:septum formation initiator family protein [Caldisericum exile]BAL81314.1 hypothetical protein CSE_11880 [Caldisericum exile AZM16c01]
MKVKTLTLLIILLILIAVYSVLFFSTVRIKKNIADLDVKIEILQTENQNLESQYLDLQDPAYIESIARKKLYMTEVKDFYVVEIRAK